MPAQRGGLGAGGEKFVSLRNLFTNAQVTLTMLQIQIEDVQLEERIEIQARRTGQTAEEFARNVLAAAISDVAFPRLNPRQHGKIMAVDLSESDELNEVQPFADVTDTAEFVRELRQHAWR